MYGDMQQQFWDVGPFAMLLQRNAVAAMGKATTGFRLGPMPDFTHYSDIRKT